MSDSLRGLGDFLTRQNNDHIEILKKEGVKKLLEEKHLSLDQVSKLAVEVFKDDRSINKDQREKIIAQIKILKAQSTRNEDEISGAERKQTANRSFLKKVIAETIRPRESGRVNEDLIKLDQLHREIETEERYQDKAKEWKEALAHLDNPKDRKMALKKLYEIKNSLIDIYFSNNPTDKKLIKDIDKEIADLREWVKKDNSIKKDNSEIEMANFSFNKVINQNLDSKTTLKRLLDIKQHLNNRVSNKETSSFYKVNKCLEDKIKILENLKE